ncbi:ParB N-terminal domain-containing protein [Vibrio crassostreae]|uniref:ParB N-terminal domain-containing protein n=1 Tax=Vibrio crassostreae TaxID=246167 RepID=UPI001B300C06|nr:ParB N-terminal domain-containing protein [Vibrio crassostreae]
MSRPKFGQQQLSSTVSNSVVVLEGATKTWSLESGKTVEGSLGYIDPENFGHVEIHPENLRLQGDVSLSSVIDIVNTVKKHGVRDELIVVQQDDRILILDGSRRFFCANLHKKRIPVWKFKNNEISVEDARQISRLSFTAKSMSWREEGSSLVKQLKAYGFVATRENLGECLIVAEEKLGINKKKLSTTRRHLASAILPKELVSLFINRDSLSSGYYKNLIPISTGLKSDEAVIALSEKVKVAINECKLIRPTDPSLTEGFMDLEPSETSDLVSIYRQEVDNYNEQVLETIKTVLSQSKSDTPANYSRNISGSSSDRTVKIVQKKARSKVSIDISKASDSDLKKIEDFFNTLLNE